jgi:hypothetical protein
MSEPIDHEGRWRIAMQSIATEAAQRRQWEQRYWDLELRLLHLYKRGPRGWWERFLFIFCIGRYRRRQGHHIGF